MGVNDALARLAAVAVAVGAVVGSTSALLKVADEARMSPAWTLPLALDGVAIVAAMAVRRRRGYWLGWVALVGAAGTSATIQWVTAPDGVAAHLAHAALPVAALLALELLVHAVAETDAAPSVAVDATLTPPPVEVQEPGMDVAELEAVPSEPAPASEPAQAPALRQPAAGALDLVAPARKILAALDLSPHDIGRPRLVELMRGDGHRLGTKKADALLALLREEVPA